MTWEEICVDPVLAQWQGRVESDKWGNVIMSPPAGADHCDYAGEIADKLREFMRGGRVGSEFPVQTDEGVKAVDVAWMSLERRRLRPRQSLIHLVAPEICVEVQSPSNAFQQIIDKLQLYFAREAKECWMCDKRGRMSFFGPEGPLPRSELCPDFPDKLEVSDDWTE